MTPRNILKAHQDPNSSSPMIPLTQALHKDKKGRNDRSITCPVALSEEKISNCFKQAKLLLMIIKNISSSWSMEN
jgi:hypothetical protein